MAVTPGRRPGRWPVTATAAVFFANGLLFASWTAHVPQVKARLGLGDAALGLALLGAPAGSVLAMLASARLLPRLGSKRMVQATLIGYCAAGPLAGLAGTVVLLFAALFLWGGFQGALDVSMNTQAVTVERGAARPLMSGLHGWWSIGAFAGAGAGVAGVTAGESLTAQLLVLGLVALLAAGWLTVRLADDPGQAPGSGPARKPASGPVRNPGAGSGGPPEAGPGRERGPGSGPRPRRGLSRPVLVLGTIALASMLGEGAAADWAAVYLRGPLHQGAAVAGLGYTVFALAMVATRLAGNRLLTVVRVRLLLPALAAVATAGLTAGLLAGRGWSVIAGFGCLGLGLALVVPTVFSAAGRLPGLSPGTAISIVSAFGWAGFVCGPPLIGGLAAATSLAAALSVLPVATAVIMVATALTTALRQPGRG
jgi:predicted MFS family arabinose efflux permease